MKSLLAAGLFFCTATVLAAQTCEQALSRFEYTQAAGEAQAALQQTPADAAMWICLARTQYERGDFQAALESLNQAADLRPQGAVAVRLGNWFGVTLRRLGQSEKAWQHQQTALALARQINDQAGLATALHNTAGMRYDRGDAFGALRDYQVSIPINPDLAERSASYNNMGLIYQDMGDVRRAREHLQAAITLNRSNNHFHHLGKHLMNLGNLERTQSRFDDAQRLLQEGHALIEQSGDVFWLGVAAHYRAWLAKDRKQIEAARTAYAEALAFYRKAGAAGEVARLTRELAENPFP